jgi:hypothetical protein
MADIVRICVDDVASSDRYDYRGRAILFAAATAGILLNSHGMLAYPVTGGATLGAMSFCDPDAFLRGELRPGGEGPDGYYEYSWCAVVTAESRWVVDLNAAVHPERAMAFGIEYPYKRHIVVMQAEHAPYVPDYKRSAERGNQWFSIPLYMDLVDMAAGWYSMIKGKRPPPPLKVMAVVSGHESLRTLRYEELKLYPSPTELLHEYQGAYQ